MRERGVAQLPGGGGGGGWQQREQRQQRPLPPPRFPSAPPAPPAAPLPPRASDAGSDALPPPALKASLHSGGVLSQPPERAVVVEISPARRPPLPGRGATGEREDRGGGGLELGG